MVLHRIVAPLNAEFQLTELTSLTYIKKQQYANNHI